jgi:acetylornithine deacetylase/succinyl-diaminopimelate desuccinylase-like protein
MLDCWRLAGASAPLNFAFMFEGEEENGSLGFQESVAANLDWFADAVLVVISNTVWVGENKPCLTYGMRGMVTASLLVSAAYSARMEHLRLFCRLVLFYIPGVCAAGDGFHAIHQSVSAPS